MCWSTPLHRIAFWLTMWTSLLRNTTIVHFEIHSCIFNCQSLIKSHKWELVIVTIREILGVFLCFFALKKKLALDKFKILGIKMCDWSVVFWPATAFTCIFVCYWVMVAVCWSSGVNTSRSFWTENDFFSFSPSVSGLPSPSFCQEMPLHVALCLSAYIACRPLCIFFLSLALQNNFIWNSYDIQCSVNFLIYDLPCNLCDIPSFIRD
jgi:hypothetical protein